MNRGQGDLEEYAKVVRRDESSGAFVTNATDFSIIPRLRLTEIILSPTP
jgi:hypothetical protein